MAGCVWSEESGEGHAEHQRTVVTAQHCGPDNTLTHILHQPLRQHKVVQPPGEGEEGDREEKREGKWKRGGIKAKTRFILKV